MSRPKTPTKIKIVKGTFRKHRENKNEPMPEKPLGDPPGCLDDLQKKVWEELAAIVPAGILTDADRIILELATRLLSELRVKGRLATGKMGHLIGCLARMGMSPSDRGKVSIPEKKQTTGWEKY